MNDVLHTGSERILAGRGDDYAKLQLHLDKLQRVAWIEDLVAPTGWEVMSTFTFRWEASVDSARRCFTRWIRKRLPGVSWYYAIEANPSREGCHVHSLWADASAFHRKSLWQEARKKWGYARIEPVRSKRDSSSYASKYLSKTDGWYDVHLQWHRLQKLHEAGFELSGEGSERNCNQVEDILPTGCEQSRRLRSDAGLTACGELEPGFSTNSGGPAAGFASIPLRVSAPAQAWREIMPGVFAPAPRGFEPAKI